MHTSIGIGRLKVDNNGVVTFNNPFGSTWVQPVTAYLID